MKNTKTHPILISGGGIAGLSLGLCLHRVGMQVLVIERAPALRTEGYMMDFFGTGWDAAERLGILDEVKHVHYPIDALEYVDRTGKPYIHIPIQRIKNALKSKYTFLRRQDLEQVLFDQTKAAGVPIRFGTSIETISQEPDCVNVRFTNGEESVFSLIIGADGIHSRVRELVFGPYAQFAKYLGYYVAAFHRKADKPLGRAFKLHEEPDLLTGIYPVAKDGMDATLIFRTHDLGFVETEKRLGIVQKAVAASDWIAPEIVADQPSDASFFFDPVSQIVMPTWHRGRVALVGDAAWCLTLLAGQGSHMALAGAMVLAEELAQYQGDHAQAFQRYEDALRPAIINKQKEAVRMGKYFVPTRSSHPALRRLVIKALFSTPGIGLSMRSFGSQSILK